MRPKAGVYMIINPNGKIYIGSTANISRRRQQYKSLDCQRQYILYNSLKKYGFGRHKFKIILVCEPSYRLIAERKLGDYYKSLKDFGGMNIRLPGYDELPPLYAVDSRIMLGERRKGSKHTEESRLKMSASAKGRKMSEEQKCKISMRLTGRVTSLEARKKLSIAQKGVKKSEEHKRKCRDRMLGKPVSEQAKAKISIALTGIKRSEETRKKMSASMTGIPMEPESIQKMRETLCRRVIDTETGEVFTGVLDASIRLNIPKITLYVWLRGKYQNKSSLKYL